MVEDIAQRIEMRGMKTFALLLGMVFRLQREHGQVGNELLQPAAGLPHLDTLAGKAGRDGSHHRIVAALIVHRHIAIGLQQLFLDVPENSLAACVGQALAVVIRHHPVVAFGFFDDGKVGHRLVYSLKITDLRNAHPYVSLRDGLGDGLQVLLGLYILHLQNVLLSSWSAFLTSAACGFRACSYRTGGNCLMVFMSTSYFFSNSA